MGVKQWGQDGEKRISHTHTYKQNSGENREARGLQFLKRLNYSFIILHKKEIYQFIFNFQL